MLNVKVPNGCEDKFNILHLTFNIRKEKMLNVESPNGHKD